MKRFPLIAALVLVVTMQSFAERVPLETARRVASTFLSNNGAKVSQLTDLSLSAGFHNLYIFDAGQGFVVMAADDCVQPILGYSLTGKFIAEGMPENISSWLQSYSDEIQYAIENQQRASLETEQLWNDLLNGNPDVARATTEVNPLIQTQWSQSSPYNNMCPSGSVTGCVATAMAQVMKYWNYPTIGIGSHDYQYNGFGILSADFGATVYDWNNMAETYSNSSTSEQKTAVATLMYHCGVSVEMKYGPIESGSNIHRSSISMNTYFNYSTSYIEKKNFSDQKWIDTLKYELNHSKPILYAGNGASGGHAFVCDGYNSDNNFHFNWGWGGSNNGYFALTLLNPGSYNFSSRQSAVINISPLTDGARPLELSLSSNERVISLSWTDNQNCNNYYIYRNNALIATTNKKIFLDSEPSYGSSTYYIREMADDILSLPSNSESAIIDYPIPIVNSLQGNASDDNVSLSWEVPDWCYPSQADDESFSYVDEERLNLDSYYDWGAGNFAISWGHRYPAENLATFNGKAIYKISFFTFKPGTFDVVVYEDTNNDKPVSEIARQSITTARIGWCRVNFSTPVIVDSSKDLWFFVINTDFNVHTVYHKTISGHTNACYFAGENPIESCSHALNNDAAWLIHAYLTDGTYTYNLYQNGTSIAENLNAAQYNASLNNNACNLFTIKTNYYGGESAASNLAGYVKGTASLSSLSLNGNDKMTITEGSLLTVSGTLSNENVKNLVLENGAQLINSSNNVKATVKKSITPYTESQNDGWHLIASPIIEGITPTVGNGLLTNTYDLYRYDLFGDVEGKEWLNYKSNPFSFITIKNKIGYLYANSGNPTLSFAGTLAASVMPTRLEYNADATFPCFNLIGNPYPCNTYVTGRDFYILQEGENGSEFVLGSNPIPPCEAIMVQVHNDNESVTFSKIASKGEPNITISVAKANTKDTTVIDMAKVSFNSSNRLVKYSLRGNGGKLYIPQNGQDFAVAYANGTNEIPVNFKAAENGTYILSIEKENLKLNYLHLIDNISGEDVDLLTMPKYVFQASTSDDAARFRLEFSVCVSTDEDM